MLDYFLRPFAGKKKAQKISEVPASKEAETQTAKLEAIQVAEQLTDDEETLLAFLNACPYADARLIAAHKIQSREGLMKAKEAMRQTDRRVVRLLQSRLDELSQQAQYLKALQECMAMGEKLLEADHVMPNLVVDLDKLWKPLTTVTTIDTSLHQAFMALRKQIDERLDIQNDLQRSLRQLIERMQALQLAQDELEPEMRAQQLEALEKTAEDILTVREAASLPKNLVLGFEEIKVTLRTQTDAHQKQYAVWQEAENFLAGLEAELTADLSQLKKKWQQFQAQAGKRLEKLQGRFEALMQQYVPATPEPKVTAPVTHTPEEALIRFRTHLPVLEKAIEEGSMQLAEENAQAIQQLEPDALPLNAEEQARWQEARQTMLHLKGWAKWSGKLAFDELIKKVEGLTGKTMPVEELAQAIQDARQQWKNLSASAGMAMRSQWQQFQNACQHAYEPVREQAAAAAQQRQENIARAQALIVQLRAFMEQMGEVRIEKAPDLEAGQESIVEESDSAEKTQTHTPRQIAVFYRNMMNNWRQLGMINRKDKKPLQTEFDQLIEPLKSYIKEQTRHEIAVRRELIEKAKNMETTGKHSAKPLRELQELWQQTARQFPLENREEQKLWQEFREVCEQVHKQRVQVNEAQEAQRETHLRQKEALCDTLETAAMEDQAAIRQLLDDTLKQWQKTGAVPAIHEEAIEQRFRQATDALRKQIQQFKRLEKQEALSHFLNRLQLCQDLENALCRATLSPTDWQAAWDQLMPSGFKEEAILYKRWEESLKAWEEKDADYVQLLEDNTAILEDRVLRMEILCGLNSPPELAEKRMQVQMEVLQESLSGNRETADDRAEWRALCQLQAHTNANLQARLLTLFNRHFQ